jgi:hypothetical protein
VCAEPGDAGKPANKGGPPMNITIRATNPEILELVRIAGTHTTGARWALTSWLAIRAKTLKEIVSAAITAKEAYFLIEYFMFKDQPLSRAVLKADIVDRYVDEIEIYYGITKEKILAAIDDLNTAQLYFLQEEAILFWKKNFKHPRSIIIERQRDLAQEIAG